MNVNVIPILSLAGGTNLDDLGHVQATNYSKYQNKLLIFAYVLLGGFMEKCCWVGKMIYLATSFSFKLAVEIWNIFLYNEQKKKSTTAWANWSFFCTPRHTSKPKVPQVKTFQKYFLSALDFSERERPQ